jgi:hypothetical protein
MRPLTNHPSNSIETSPKTSKHSRQSARAAGWYAHGSDPAIAQLSEPHTTALRIRDEHLSSEDIAARLGIDIEAVEPLVRIAVAKLSSRPINRALPSAPFRSLRLEHDPAAQRRRGRPTARTDVGDDNRYRSDSRRRHQARPVTLTLDVSVNFTLSADPTARVASCTSINVPITVARTIGFSKPRCL